MIDLKFGIGKLGMGGDVMKARYHICCGTTNI